ncbi:MAG: hypothetical protein VZR11_10530 [Succinimonas sp.]|nr:hypothetical protein [Succinimonas sp.]
MAADIGFASKRAAARAAGVILLALILTILGFTASLMKPEIITADLAALLPEEQGPGDLGVPEALSREIIIMADGIPDFGETPEAGGSSPERDYAPLRQALSRTQEILRQYPEIVLEDAAVLEAAGKYFFDNRYRYPPYFKNDAELREAVFEAVYSPFGGLTDLEYRRDPFLIMRHLSGHLAGSSFGDIRRDEQGFLYLEREGQKHFLLSGSIALGQRISRERGKRLLEELFREKERLREQGIRLSFLSGYFYETRAYENSVSDMSRIGGFSAIVLIIIFICLFRGIRELLGTVLFLALFLGGGLGAVLLFLGHLHVIALGMGAALIGICADYLIHSFMFREPGNPAARNQLARALIASGITSILAYLAMTLTALSALREVALMAAVSLSLAVLTAIFVIIPFWSSRARTPASGQDKGWFPEMSRRLRRHLGLSGGIMLILFGVYAASEITPDDRVSRLQDRDGVLTEMDSQIRELMVHSGEVSWYLISGRDLEAALETCEEIRDSLPQDLKKAALFPCAAVPSRSTAEESILRYRAALPALLEAYSEQGIPLETASDIAAELAAAPGDPVIPAVFSRLFPADAVLLRTSGDPEIRPVLERELLARGNVKRLDKKTEWNNAFRDFRIQLTRVLLGAFLVALTVLTFFMGRRVVTGFLIPVLGGLSGGLIAARFLSGGYFCLFSALALFMILGLGADYCIFMHSASPAAIRERRRALLASWLTTEAAFGALAFSGTRALAAFGSALALGLLAVFVLALLLSYQEPAEEGAEQQGNAV